MSKHKSKKSGRPRPPLPHRHAPFDVQGDLARAQNLVDSRQPNEARELLLSLLESHPRMAELHFAFGRASIAAGDWWTGLAGYEQALELSGNPAVWKALAVVYLSLEMNAHALQAFRQVLRRGLGGDETEDMRRTAAALEQEVQELAQDLRMPVDRAQKGLHLLEEGNRALEAGEFRACITTTRQAIRLLGHWPPPYNNLSLALFLDGRPDEAIATARQVLSRDPANLQALSNAIRFLAWTGHEAEARALWLQLRALEPQGITERLKKAEAAAILDEDESVYELLKPLDKTALAKAAVHGFARRFEFFRAVAEANLGKPTALRRMKAIEDRTPGMDTMLEALSAGRPGLGWAERYPYFNVVELMPVERLEEIGDLLDRRDHSPEKQFRGLVDRFVARFPQVVLVAEKLIWEEQQPDHGITLLEAIATPSAYGALRRFGLSQAGEDDARMEALYALSDAGQIAPDETLTIWRRGRWRETKLRSLELSEERESAYAPRVAERLNAGTDAFQQGDLAEAERQYRLALDLEPRAKEAYNNLGAVYTRRQEDERAKEMFRAALAIDPLYALPLCNLAGYLLDDEDADGALALLAPLAEGTHFTQQEMVSYSYVQARALIQKEEYEAARISLEAALEVWPDHDASRELLARLDALSRLRTGFSSFFERQHRREAARRVRLQARLSTPDPPLAVALSLYTKEALTGIRRAILPHGGGSALRKAELVELIVDVLQDPETIDRIAAGLADPERDALGRVLGSGGHMAWAGFNAAFDNDLEESPYWNWHEPQTTMGRLRLRGLLVETTVDGQLLVAVPLELRPLLAEKLG